jgi:hypothetical protein
MSSIQKLPNVGFKAIVRFKYFEPLYVTFPTKTKTNQWGHAIESDAAMARILVHVEELNLRQPQRCLLKWGRCIFSNSELHDSFMDAIEVPLKTPVTGVVDH